VKDKSKKTSIHKRILRAFFIVLFFAFALTLLVFDFGRQQVENSQAREILYEYGLWYGFFDSRTHWFLLGFVGLIFAVAALAAYFLSSALTRPIVKLSKFAQGIGRGDFSPNDFEFADKELDDLNSALNKSVRQLDAYDREQKTFFQNASHELRTPLMSIKCYAEGISAGIMKPDDAAETILQETDRLTELVKEMLYISQIDNITTTYKKAEVDLVQLIKDCAARQQAQADKGGISFVFDHDDSLNYKCVPELMSRAVDNLISNALRYAASEVSLSVHLRSGYVGIKVADDGKGISEEALPHIFERFYKGEGGNTGIGLSIVKTIISQHKGSIAVENSGQGQGAVFTIILPKEKGESK